MVGLLVIAVVAGIIAVVLWKRPIAPTMPETPPVVPPVVPPATPPVVPPFTPPITPSPAPPITPSPPTVPVPAVGYKLVVVTEPWAGGAVTISPEKMSYTFGELVQLKAWPAPTWSFVGWFVEDENISYSPEATVVMGLRAEYRIVARFRSEVIGYG